MRATRWYVPELHDVTPADRTGLSDMLALLDAGDARARDAAALLIVPDWGEAAPIDAEPQMIDTIRSLPGERVLHGLTHRVGERAWDRLWYGTPNESEFAALGADAALARLRAGVARFERAFGERPRWFCAPRWQQSAGTRAALDALGIRGIMARDGCSLPTGGRADVPALWFDDGERALTRSLALAARRWRVARLLAAERPFRLALHPRDARYARTRQEIVALLARLADAGWEPRGLQALTAAPHTAAA